ncbi:MAG: hypothetical protein Unbinned7794contig1000_4 [Prokaryotic dsDNA virus sp.]|nr:MAG: hypothetical protein Unbinned7794contig1000_4 [Prokaryotic dsDNA virus sp.]
MSIQYNEMMGPGFFMFFQVPTESGPGNSFKTSSNKLRLMYEQNLVATIRTVVEVINANT